MLEKWMISKYSDVSIRKRLFLRETEFFYVDGHKNRHAKSNSYEEYFDTWEEAKARLTEIAVTRIDSATLALENAIKYLNEVNALEKPQEAE